MRSKQELVKIWTRPNRKGDGHRFYLRYTDINGKRRCESLGHSDRHIFKFNVENGTIDLQTGTLMPHDPLDMITQLAPVKYAAVDCPRWMGCLNTWHRGCQETIDYLQRLAGMCLAADISSRKLPVNIGVGKNGKSVFWDTIMGMLGDYSCKAPRTLLRQNFGESHSTDVAGLLNKRLVVASESEKGMKLNTSRVKELTGNEPVRARFMRCDDFDFKPTFTIVLMTQNLPVIDETADAIWDRLHKVDWPVRIPANMQNTCLSDELKEEWPGILHWAVQGCMKWLADGDLFPTDAISLHTAEYRNSQNPVRTFIDECCEKGSGLTIPVTDLLEHFRTWTRISGGDPAFLAVTNNDFSDMVKSCGFEKKSSRIHGTVCKCWFGWVYGRTWNRKYRI